MVFPQGGSFVNLDGHGVWSIETGNSHLSSCGIMVSMYMYNFQEEELRKEGGKYAHLNEDLHLMVECFAETIEAYSRITHAMTEVKKYLNPVSLTFYGSDFACYVYICLAWITSLQDQT